MSTHKVEVVNIDEVERHPNADRLDLVRVKGWSCVAGRSEPTQPKYKPGDRAIYIPIDSVLEPKIEQYLFSPGSKIRLSNSRVRTIKIRGAVSQGMVVDIGDEILREFPELMKVRVGDDVSKILGISKYEPPVRELPEHMKAGAGSPKVQNNPHFKKYTDIENLKNYQNVFLPGENVSVTEKLHGTSTRYAKLPTVPRTLWQKVLRFFGLLPKFEFCYGSRNVQLQNQWIKKTYYSSDVYSLIAKAYGLDNLLQPGEALYGEIVGEGIQKNYDYGFVRGEKGFFAYDVMVDGKFLNPDQFRAWCKLRGIPTVPLLYEGPYDKAVLDKLRSGDSTVGGQKVREGIVVKPIQETLAMCGRKVLKHINDDYLLGDQTEFH